MSRTLAVLALALVAAVMVATASAATPKKFYWSEEKAESLAAAKVRIPYCKVFPADSKCPGYTYGFYGLNEVLCTGADEKGETFTYARFRCRFLAGVRVQDYARGSLTLYPTGKTTFRWKLTSISRI
jgi:hypothetical protein